MYVWRGRPEVIQIRWMPEIPNVLYITGRAPHMQLQACCWTVMSAQTITCGHLQVVEHRATWCWRTALRLNLCICFIDKTPFRPSNELMKASACSWCYKMSKTQSDSSWTGLVWLDLSEMKENDAADSVALKFSSIFTWNLHVETNPWNTGSSCWRLMCNYHFNIFNSNSIY